MRMLQLRGRRDLGEKAIGAEFTDDGVAAVEGDGRAGEGGGHLGNVLAETLVSEIALPWVTCAERSDARYISTWSEAYRCTPLMPPRLPRTATVSGGFPLRNG